MDKDLTAPIIKRLTTTCPFPEVFEDTKRDEHGVMSYPRRKIAHIRADHDGYRWWSTVWPCHDDLATREMKREIDDTYAALTAKDAFCDLPMLQRFCALHQDACVGDSGTEYNFYLEGALCLYWMRLITRKGDYNLYLSAYAKENVAEKYFTYLNRLRESGEANMMGAVPYLQRQFPELAHDRNRATEILLAWMHSFDRED